MPPSTRLVLGSPAAAFADGFPLGNGRLGAMTYGAVGVEEADLNVDTLWSGGPRPAAGHRVAPGALDAVRSAVARRDFAAADDLARRLQEPGWTQAYQPLGRLRWEYAPDLSAGGDVHGTLPDGYERGLDLAEAVAWVRYPTSAGPVVVESFVSAPAGVLVVEVRGPDALLHAATPGFEVPHPGARTDVEDSGGAVWTRVTGRAPEASLPEYLGDVPDAVVHGRLVPDADGLVDAGMGFAAVAATQRTADGAVRLVLSAATGFRGYRERPSADAEALVAAAQARVSAALARTTADLRVEHVTEHRGWFDRCRLRLGGTGAGGQELAEKTRRWFDLGRYLLIASSRPGTQAANLQGIWNADLRPGWSANYTTNINVEMNYWGAEVTGLGELHGPLIDLVTDCVAAGRAVAGDVYGAPGSCTHHNTDLWRFCGPVSGDPSWSNWPSGQQWMAAHVWEHWETGGDDAFGEDVALPVHRAQAEFVLAMLVPDAAGALVVSPSTSPEHHFRLPDGGRASVSAGAAMDQELAYEVLTRFLVLAERFSGDDPDDAALAVRAREALARWRPPAVCGGRLLEWADDREEVEPGHRHLSHLYGLFPGTRIHRAGPPEELAAAREALRRRLGHGSGGTSWSQAWLLCLAARLGAGDLVRDAVLGLHDRLSSPSLLSLHPLEEWPGGAIFQVDGNLGAVRGIAETVLQSVDGVLHLLPALPAEIVEGEAAGLCAAGGRVVAVRWEQGRLVEAEVRSRRAGRVDVEVVLAGRRVRARTAAGEGVALTTAAGAAPGATRLSWMADAGTTVVLTVAPGRPGA